MKRERRLELRKLLEGGAHAEILIQIHQLETDVESYEQTLASLTKENDDLKEWRKKTQDYIRKRDGQISDLHMQIGNFKKAKKLSNFLAGKMEEIVCSNCPVSPIHTCDGTVAGLMAARDTHEHCKGCSTITHTETFKKGEFPEGFETKTRCNGEFVVSADEGPYAELCGHPNRQQGQACDTRICPIKEE